MDMGVRGKKVGWESVRFQGRMQAFGKGWGGGGGGGWGWGWGLL